MSANYSEKRDIAMHSSELVLVMVGEQLTKITPDSEQTYDMRNISANLATCMSYDRNDFGSTCSLEDMKF